MTRQGLLLERIREAFNQVKTRRKPVVILLTGPWGTGKTALIEQPSKISAGNDRLMAAATNASRFHKAFDEVIDSLPAALSKLGTSESADLVPEDAWPCPAVPGTATSELSAFSLAVQESPRSGDARRALPRSRDLLRELANKNPLSLPR